MRFNRLVLAGFAVAVAAAAHAQEIHVVVDGDRVHFRNQPPVMVNDRVLVPLRGVFEELGAEVDWNPETQTVTAVREDTKMKLRIGDNSASVNGEDVRLDVPAQIIDSSTMVPLRFVGEALGERVHWDENTQTVNIMADNEYQFKRDHDRNKEEDRDQDRDQDQGRGPKRGWHRHEGDGPPPPPAVEDEAPEVIAPPVRDEMPPPPPGVVVLEPDTVVPVSLDFSFNVDRCRPGQRISTTIRDYPGFPRGSRAEGIVRNVVRDENGPPSLDLQFDRIVTPAGRSYHVEGRSFPIDSHYVRTGEHGMMSVRNPRSPNGMLRVGNGDTFGVRLTRTVRIEPEPRRWRH